MDLTWLWASLIGVFGTALGSVLGWFLSRKSNKKLVLTVADYSKSNPEESNNHIDLYLSIFVYNPSDNMKIIRNLQLELCQSNGSTIFLDVKDLDNIQTVFAGIKIPTNLSLENIPPKMACLFRTVSYINNVEITGKEKLVLSYLNEKGKKIKTDVSALLDNDE